MLNFRTNLTTPTVVAACFMLSNCMNLQGSKGSERSPAGNVENLDHENISGPFITDTSERDSLFTYIDQSKGNIFSIDSRLIDALQIRFENNKIFLDKEQLESLGFDRCIQKNDLAIENSEGKLRFVQLPTKQVQDISPLENSFVSMTSIAAQVSNSQIKFGILMIVGEAAPYKTIFAYQSDQGELIVENRLENKFPGQFKAAVNWHQGSVNKMYKLSKSEVAVDPEQLAALRSSLPARFNFDATSHISSKTE